MNLAPATVCLGLVPQNLTPLMSLRHQISHPQARSTKFFRCQVFSSLQIFVKQTQNSYNLSTLSPPHTHPSKLAQKEFAIEIKRRRSWMTPCTNAKWLQAEELKVCFLSPFLGEGSLSRANPR